MSFENGRILPGLNIQLFAAEDHVNLTKGEQARYVNTIMRRLGRPNSLPLAQYMAKSQSVNAAYSLFYVGGELSARDRQSNRNDTNNNFNDVEGVKAGNLITAIRVTPTTMEVPLWVDDRDFDKSQLNEQGAISDMQVTAIYKECDYRISRLLKDIVTNKKRTVKGNNNEDVEIIVPDINFFGDKTKPFAEQVKEFKRMMRKAKKLAKADGKRIGIISGEDGTTELTDCEKFTNKDWVTVNGETPNQTGDPLDKLCGGYVEELFTFDEIFYPTGNETEGYFVVLIEGSLGQDNKKTSINPIIEHVKFKKAFYMDVEVSNATELLQGLGILVFQYKKDIATATASVMAARTVPQPQQAPNVVDYDKAIELEKARAKRIAEERELLKEKQALLKTEQPQEPATVVEKKPKPKENPTGTKE